VLSISRISHLLPPRKPMFFALNYTKALAVLVGIVGEKSMVKRVLEANWTVAAASRYATNSPCHKSALILPFAFDRVY
jgi:hypothetical protein